MDWMEKLLQKESLKNTLTDFLDQYGFSGLEQALAYYSSMQPEYICKTKSAIDKIRIDDIYYLEIQTHTIHVHTQYDTYKKYGTLTKEEELLSPYGFMKCNQSCIVSLRKIRNIRNNTITLINNVQLHMSQHYTARILIAFSHRNPRI